MGAAAPTTRQISTASTSSAGGRIPARGKSETRRYGKSPGTESIVSRWTVRCDRGLTGQIFTAAAQRRGDIQPSGLRPRSPRAHQKSVSRVPPRSHSEQAVSAPPRLRFENLTRAAPGYESLAILSSDCLGLACGQPDCGEKAVVTDERHERLSRKVHPLVIGSTQSAA
jgi:hypothetical protein